MTSAATQTTSCVRVEAGTSMAGLCPELQDANVQTEDVAPGRRPESQPEPPPPHPVSGARSQLLRGKGRGEGPCFRHIS